MRTFTSYLRVLFILAIVLALAEFFIDSGDVPAFIKYPQVSLFLGLFAVLLIGLEVMIGAMNSLTNALSAAKGIEKEKENDFAWFKNLMAKLWDSAPLDRKS